VDAVGGESGLVIDILRRVAGRAVGTLDGICAVFRGRNLSTVTIWDRLVRELSQELRARMHALT